MKTHIIPSIALVALVCASPVAAQDPAAAGAPVPAAQAPAKPVNLGDMRHHIYVMEGALARAVDYGAKQLNREILQVMPGVFMLEGEARARGVHLDGYGVFFDVRVPMLRQSMVWSLRMMMEQNDTSAQNAINELKKGMQGITDPATRASMEQAVRRLERQVPGAARNPQVAPGVVMPDVPSAPAVGAAAASGVAATRAAAASQVAPAPPESVWVKDPNRAYTEAVTRALVDAMIDYSTPMNVGADQWLTVAARDDEGRDSLAPQDPLEEVVTMIYRIKGSDLHLYRTGKIDRDEVRKRVQISHF
ncbi:MAG TPA: hypothetical protein VEC39_13430 [Vicinamibacterales bacterium]|nr:hypothetical protein [Vicinamibacterales bacterium]